MTTELSPRNRADALYQVIVEVRRLFHRLANATDRLHVDVGVPVAQRAVLETLADDGPSPVPALARRKGVTRQHIQVLANALQEAGLVEAVTNPEHRRSPRLALTPAGRRLFEAMRSREGHFLQGVAHRLGAAPLPVVARALSALGDAVEASLDQPPRPAPTRRASHPRKEHHS
jgi:DNA-binding MarR family transcriptional regulator